jgi:hypothetical protein
MPESRFDSSETALGLFLVFPVQELLGPGLDSPNVADAFPIWHSVT